MATKNIVPRNANEGQLGTAAKPWAKVVATELDIFSKAQEWEQDFYSATVFPPLTFAAITTGTLVLAAPAANHPGAVSIKTSTSADSGGNLTTGASLYFVSGSGGQFLETVFEVDVTTGTTGQIGWHDAFNKNAPARGIYLDIAGATVSGICVDFAGSAATGSTYTVTAGVWYRAKISANAALDAITFSLYACADGALVWTDTVSSHIITSNSQPTTCKVTNSNGGAAAVALLTLDWAHFGINRVLVR